MGGNTKKKDQEVFVVKDGEIVYKSSQTNFII